MADSVGQVMLDLVLGKETIGSEIRSAVNEVSGTLNNASATWSQKLGAIGGACTQAGAAIAPVSAAVGVMAAKAASSALTFEDAMAKVSTIADTTQVPLSDLKTGIMNLSNQTGVSSSEIAENVYNAISAGQKTGDAVNFVSQAMTLAKAGFADTGDALDVLTTVLNAYGMEADQAAHVSDVLIGVQNKGKTTVGELSQTMGKVIPTANAFGVSLENLGAAYEVMTSKGIATAESTTYINSMLNELGKNGTKASTVLKEKTGQSFQELMASGKSLGDVLQIVQSAADESGLSLADMFGSAEAGKAAMSILSDGTESFNNNLKELNETSGATNEAADKMNTNSHNIKKALNAMSNAGQSLADTLLTSLAPVIQIVAEGISTVCGFVQNLPGPIQTVIGVLVVLVAAAGPVLLIVGQILTTISTLGPAIAGIGTMLTGSAIPALGAIAPAALPAIAIVAALAFAAYEVITHWDELCAMFGPWLQSFVQFFTDTWNGCVEWVANLGQTISAGWQSFCDTVTTFCTQIQQTASSIWQAICSTVSGLVSGLVSSVTGFFRNLASTVSSIFGAIASTAASIWGGISSTVSGLAYSAYSAVSGAFWDMVGAAAGASSGVYSAITSGIGSAVSWLQGLAGQAWSWGADMISGFVSGITSSIGSVIGAVSDIAGTVSSYLHFSRPDVGPLHEYEEWMPDFMAGLASGIRGNMGLVTSQVAALSNGMALGPQLPEVSGAKMVGARDTGGGVSAAFDKLLEKLDGMTGAESGGDFVFPIYIGSKQIDEIVLSAQDRARLRSGGRC